MKGIIGTASPISDKVGVVRQLAYDPKILNTRGFLDANSDSANGNTNIYCPTELLNSFTPLHADPARVAMQSTQQKHLIPVKDQTQPMFGSGIDKALPYILGDDFSIVAKEDGIVEKIDKQKEVAILKYNSGKKQLVDLSSIMAKNSNGGFYCNNKKEMLFEEGMSFKKNDIIAKHPGYYIGKDPRNQIYSTGRICKVAVANLDGTMEDSCMVVDDMCEKMASMITMHKVLKFDVNSNIDYLVKKGQHIHTGDTLCIADTSFEDASVNDILDRLGNEFDDTLDDISKNIIKSKYSGEVVDIDIYYNRDINEFSPSVQKILKDYIRENKAKYEFVKKHSDPTDLDLVNIKSIEKINQPKILGEDVDGILIKIYIEHQDNLGVGDKITHGTALKTTISDIIPKGEEPISEWDSDYLVEAVFPPMSIVNRMTIDFFFQLYLNKGLYGLKYNLKKLYGLL